MKATPIALALTLVNLGLLAYQAVRLPRAFADEPPAILKGRGLEIVDEQGRLRAQIKVEPANATFKMPDGTTGYPETVIFRLVTADGKPRVKLTTSDRGSGLMLLGESDTTHTLLHADRAKTSLLLRDEAAKQRVLEP
jgi:hypothetical protein